MPTVINRVCGICSGLENDSGLDLARDVVFTVVVVAERIVRHLGGEPGCRCPGCRLELPRPLPFGATREPEHQPVIWVILLGEVGREEEGYERGVSACQDGGCL